MDLLRSPLPGSLVCLAAGVDLPPTFDLIHCQQ